MTQLAWREIYKQRTVDRDKALKAVGRGAKVFFGTACAEPQHLVQGLMDTAGRLQDVQILHYLTLGKAPYTDKRFDTRFRHNAFFVGPNSRDAINQARADYTPVFVFEIPGLFRRRLVPIDVAMIQVSPPDAHGFVSLGISVDIVRAAAESARVVIAQVNRHMPRTQGDSFIHVSKIHYFVHHDSPLTEFAYAELTPEEEKISKNAARLIRDGDTIHIGFGHLPYGVTKYLSHRRDLGVHTEVVSDSIMSMVENGVITGERKTLHKGKIVCSFCIGSKALYEYVDNNPRFAFHPAEYVYNPLIIARNERMISIGSALEVDLSGQICSESQGYIFRSGLGGRLDFIRGAALSEGGRSVIVVPSTTRDGSVSRIVPHLAEGGAVAATRGDVKYVVTEFGTAYLHGKSIRERAMALINIAHPRFRAGLLEEAKRRAYVYADQILITSDTNLYPEDEESYAELADGTVVFIRPMKPTDEPLLQDFFYSHSEETIYRRYFRSVKAMPHAQAQTLVNIDYHDRMAFVATLGEIGMERIIGVGRYAKEADRPGWVETAYTVHEDFQSRGLGSILQERIDHYAEKMGFKGIAGYLFRENQAMLKVYEKPGPIQRQHIESGVIRVWRAFSQESDQ